MPSASGTRGPCGTIICISPSEPEFDPLPAGTYCSSAGGGFAPCDPDLAPSCIGYCDGVTASCNAPFLAKAYPNYMIFSVIYAPPSRSSTMSYTDGTSVGSTVTTSGSFKSEFEHEVSAGLHSPHSMTMPYGGGAFTLTVSHSEMDTDKSSTEMKETTVSGWTFVGGSDGINHDDDQIWLWLNPQVNLRAIFPDQTGEQIQTTIVQKEGEIPKLIYVNVGWLKYPDLLPAQIRAELELSNITPDDYATILAADPFSDGSTTVDPRRFQFLRQIPYEPAYPEVPPSYDDYGITHSSTVTTTHTTLVEQKVKLAFEVSLDYLWFSSKVKDSHTFTWQHTDEFVSATGTTTSASARIFQPSTDFTGPPLVNIYRDTSFNTFMFALTY